MQPLGISQSPITTTPLWRPTLTSNRSSEVHIASALRYGAAIAVSDGSYKENWGTSVLIIEGYEYDKRRIAVTCTSLGHSKYQYVYIIELSVIIHVVSIVEEISLKFNISKGAITISCYGLNKI